MKLINTIVIPSRPQVDTSVAIFLLKHFGKDVFSKIENAKIVVDPRAQEDATDDDRFLLDVGGGQFDHHTKKQQTTASQLVANHLQITGDPTIKKMLEFARRDDFYGKGIVSEDPLDRAFGLPGLLVNLNKQYPNDPNKVVSCILPLIEAHLTEEHCREVEMPEEVKNKFKSNDAEDFKVKHRKKNLKVVYVQSDNTSLGGYLRSSMGGKYDVVIQHNSTGHVVILTRQIKRIDLRSTVFLLRAYEAKRRGVDLDSFTPSNLSVEARMPEIPQWHYDRATNSIINGGTTEADIEPTVLSREDLIEAVLEGLQETIWSPVAR